MHRRKIIIYSQDPLSAELVAAIIDCAKSAAEKRRRREEELQRQYAEQVKNIGATDGVFYPNNERL